MRNERFSLVLLENSLLRCVQKYSCNALSELINPLVAKIQPSIPS